MSDEANTIAFAAGATRMDAIEKRLEKMEGKLDVMAESMNKQKGFIAGVSMAFSLLATTVIGLVVYIWQRYAGQ